MENDLNQFIEKESNYYKPQFKNQNIFKEKDFQLWYQSTKIYIDKENKKRGVSTSDSYDKDASILTISFCNKCKCYAICSFTYAFSYIKCSKCLNEFCIGCYRDIISLNDNGSLCLKGYLKLLYLRTKYRRAGRLFTSDIANRISIILIILFSPAYFGFVSNIIGLEIHPNIRGEFKNIVENYFLIILIYSYMKGILMFPFILFFLPLSIILLIPCIFSNKYYFSIAAFYTSALDQGIYKDKNDFDIA